MTLTGRVTALESGKAYNDGLERATIKVAEASIMYAELRIPNVDGLRLDDEVKVFVVGRDHEVVIHNAPFNDGISVNAKVVEHE